MKKLSSLIMASCLVTSLSHAGGREAGNGGDVVVCSSGVPFNIRLLDYYEAEFIRKAKLDLPEAKLNLTDEENIKAMVLAVLERIKPHSKTRYNVLKSWLDTFWKEAEFLNNIEMEDVPDSKHVAIPSGCKVIQIAVQGSWAKKIAKKYYVINQLLWNNLSLVDRVGLVRKCPRSC